MDIFAEENIQFDDGQRNKEELPEEIQKYGFRPPIRANDGSITAGHRLAAQHLNYIINDLYKILSSQQSRITDLESKVKNNG